MSNNIKVWFVAVGAILMALFSILPGATTLNLFTMPLVDNLGVSRTEVSLMFSISSFVAIFAAMIVGPLLKKIGVKPVVVIGGVCLFAYFATLSLADSMLPIYIAVAAKGISGTFAGMAMAQIVIAQWFSKGRGTVMSFVSIATAILGAVAMTSIAMLIDSLGYRTVAMGEAIIFGGLIVILGIFVISDSPEKTGYKPWGYEEKKVVAQEDANAKPVVEKAALGFKHIAKFPSFWLILLATLLAACSAQVFNAHGSPYFQSIGLTAVEAGFAMSLYTLVGMPWSLLFGAVSDKKSVPAATIINGAAFAIAMLLAFMWTGYTGAIIVAILYAAAGPLSVLLGPLLTTNLFGTKEAGTLVGFVRAAAACGAMLGPLLAGLLFDITQSYTLVLEIVGVFAIIIVLITMYAGGKGARKKIQAKIEEISKSTSNVEEL